MIAEPAPLPGRLPVVGHLPRLLRRPLELLGDAQSHGDVVTIFLGSAKAYFVNQPEHLHRMLVTAPGDFDKGVHFEKAELVIGNSLPVSAGVVHRRHRKLIMPAFGQAHLRGYFDVMRDCSQARIGTWSPATDLFTEVRQLVGTITARTLFSIDAAESSAAETDRARRRARRGRDPARRRPTGLLEKLPLPSNRPFDRARARTRELVDDIIRNHGGSRPDLLSTLLAAGDDGWRRPRRR